jgi:hypothetical protein
MFVNIISEDIIILFIRVIIFFFDNPIIGFL